VTIFLKNLRIGSFPQLESFLYYNDGIYFGEMSPALRDALCFFNASRPVLNLRVITLFHWLIGVQLEYEESMTANGDAWRELDRVLASGHFAGLQKMYMNVGLSLFGLDTVDSTRPRVQDVVRADFLDLFCELRKLGISVEVDVTISR